MSKPVKQAKPSAKSKKRVSHLLEPQDGDTVNASSKAAKLDDNEEDGSKSKTKTVELKVSPMDFTLADMIRDAEMDSRDAEQKTLLIQQKLQQLSDEQLTRFEFFFRSHFKKGKVRDILIDTLGKPNVSDEMAVVAGGLAKLFVGEVVDAALVVLQEDTENIGGLKPKHIEEAMRRMKSNELYGRTFETEYLVDGYVRSNNKICTSKNVSGHFW